MRTMSKELQDFVDEESTAVMGIRVGILRDLG
jgi:hypothetical protein